MYLYIFVCCVSVYKEKFVFLILGNKKFFKDWMIYKDNNLKLFFGNYLIDKIINCLIVSCNIIFSILYFKIFINIFIFDF